MLFLHNINKLKKKIYSDDLVTKAMKQTDDRVNEVKKRAEEAVSDVKRQAVVELQKAVSAAEDKANDALTLANQRMDQAVQEARRQASEESSNINQTEHSKDVCALYIFIYLLGFSRKKLYLSLIHI